LLFKVARSARRSSHERPPTRQRFFDFGRLWKPARAAALALLLLGCGGSASDADARQVGTEDEELEADALRVSSNALVATGGRCGTVCTWTASCSTICNLAPGEPETCAGFGVCRDLDTDHDGLFGGADNCPGTANPDQRDCDRDGQGDACDSENRVPTLQLCHFDIDRHLFETKIEVYTADAVYDAQCGSQPIAYPKRRMATVTCDNFTALFDSSSCGRRVTQKVTDLVAQGYVPTTREQNQDACPKVPPPPSPPAPPPLSPSGGPYQGSCEPGYVDCTSFSSWASGCVPGTQPDYNTCF
jgi:hypothetical protein